VIITVNSDPFGVKSRKTPVAGVAYF